MSTLNEMIVNLTVSIPSTIDEIKSKKSHEITKTHPSINTNIVILFIQMKQTSNHQR